MDISTLKPHEQRLLRDLNPNLYPDDDQDSLFGDDHVSVHEDGDTSMGDDQALPDLGPLLEYNMRHDAEQAALNAPNEVPSANDLPCPVSTAPEAHREGGEVLDQPARKVSCEAVTIDGLTFPSATIRKVDNTTQGDIQHATQPPAPEPTTADDIAMVDEVTCISHAVSHDTSEQVLSQPQQDHNLVQSTIRVPTSNPDAIQQAAQPPAQPQLTPVQPSLQTQICTPVKPPVQQQTYCGKASKQDAFPAHMQVPLRQHITQVQPQAGKTAQTKLNIFREHLFTAAQVSGAQATPLASAAFAGRQRAGSIMRSSANTAVPAIVGIPATGKHGGPNMTPEGRGPPALDGNASTPSAAGSGDNSNSAARALGDSSSQHGPPTLSPSGQVLNAKGQPLRDQEVSILKFLAENAPDSAFMEPFKTEMRAKRKASIALDPEPSGRRTRARADSAGSAHSVVGAAPGGPPRAIDSGSGTARYPRKSLPERINERVVPPSPSHDFYNPAELYCITMNTGCALGLAEMSINLVQEYLQFGTVLGIRVRSANEPPDDAMAVQLEERLRAVSYLIRNRLADTVIGRIQSGAIRGGSKGNNQASSRGSADGSVIAASQAAAAAARPDDQTDQRLKAALAKHGANGPYVNATLRPIQHDPQHGVYKSLHRPENQAPGNKGKAVAPPHEMVFKAGKATAASRSATPQALAAPSRPAAGPLGRAPSPPPRVPPVDVLERGEDARKTTVVFKDGRKWVLVKKLGKWKDCGPAPPDGEPDSTKHRAQQQLQIQGNAHQVPTTSFGAQVPVPQISGSMPASDNALPAPAALPGVGLLPPQAASDPQADLTARLLRLETILQNFQSQAPGNPHAMNSSLMAIDQLAMTVGAPQQNMSTAGAQLPIPASFNASLGTSTAMLAPVGPASLAMPMPNSQAFAGPANVAMNAGAEQTLFAPLAPAPIAQGWFGGALNSHSAQYNIAAVSAEHVSGNTVHVPETSSSNVNMSQMQIDEKPGSSAADSQVQAASGQTSRDLTEAELDAIIQDINNTNGEDLLPPEVLQSLDMSQFDGLFGQ